MCSGQVLRTAPPSHHLQSAASYQKMGVFNMCKVLHEAETWVMTVAKLDLYVKASKTWMWWFRHVEHSTGLIAEVCKLNVVPQKRPGRPKKMWDKGLMDDRKKPGILVVSADPQKAKDSVP